MEFVDTPVTTPVAIGDPETGYFIPTVPKADRIWPPWSLGHFVKEFANRYPLLNDRFDNGGDFTHDHIHEMQKMIDSQFVIVGPHVKGLLVANSDGIFFPMIFSMRPEKGHVSKWLDTMPTDINIFFPEVIDLKFAQMLHRRGYQVRALEFEDDYLPVHVRLADDPTNDKDPNRKTNQ